MRSDVNKAFELLQSATPADRERALQLLQNTVFSFSMTVCGHREDAEDTMQEVLLKAISHVGRFETPKALTTWLYTVARNRCWMSRRRSKFAPAENLSLEELMPNAGEMDRLEAMADTTPSPEKNAIATQDKEQLQQAILEIPPAYRLVLVLHDVEELSSEEIARILNLKQGTVRVRLHRARLFLRKELAQLALREARPDGNATPAARRCSRQCKRVFANLSDYLDGVLDETLCRELERHMHGCKPCQAFLSSLQSSIQQTHAIPMQLPDPQLAAEFREQLARQAQA